MVGINVYTLPGLVFLLLMSPLVRSDTHNPSCDTVIRLENYFFNGTCPYNTNISHTWNTNAEMFLRIIVKTLAISPTPMSGTLQMRTNDNNTFILSCSEADVTSTTKSSTVKTIALIAGCTAGGVAIVVLIIIVVVIYRRKKGNWNNEATMKNDDATVKTEDSRSRNNDSIDIENELYRPLDDIPTSSEISLNDFAVSQIAEDSKNVMSPNGDIYAIVNKSRNNTNPPQSGLNDKTAPSGDMYAIVDKSRLAKN